MSHPFRLDFDSLATEIIGLAMGVGINGHQSHTLVRARLEALCRDYACRAAGVAGNDPSGIDGLIWFKHDGWDHGGSAITWREEAEERGARLRESEALADKLGQGLAHMEHCRCCGDDSWSACERGGREASAALEEWRAL